MGSALIEAIDLWCLRVGEGAELLRGHPWRRFVVLGDSVAEGLCEPVDGYPELQWADRIAAELRAVRPGLACLNLGRHGLRAHEVRATQLAPALEFDPDLALVSAAATTPSGPVRQGRPARQLPQRRHRRGGNSPGAGPPAGSPVDRGR